MPERSSAQASPLLEAQLVELQQWVEQEATLAPFRDELFQRLHYEVDHLQPSVAGLVQVLHKEAERLGPRVFFQDVGTVRHIGNGVATLSGLRRVRIEELVTFPTGAQGMVLGLDHDRVDVILLGSDLGIQGGDLVTTTNRRLQVPVGHELLGRVVNPLGEPLDGRGPVGVHTYQYLERTAPRVVERSPVREPLYTGQKVVDALLPLGRGQREVIVGNRQTGKTALAVDAILRQRDTDVLCVYVGIGQKKSSTLTVIEALRSGGGLKHTIAVVSNPDDPPALRYLAPYAGCTMGEHLMYHHGRDVLIVYDDLSKHADSYRELSLLLRRPPGREAYPGDIFYIHSRLLERACKLSQAAGGGSLTALPIAELQRGNIAAYIPTNLISITDGQIVFDSDLFNRDIKPAIDVGKSVSRVGGAAQTKAMREVAKDLRLQLSQFEEVARFARFGTEVDQATRRQIDRGQRLQMLLTQSLHRPMSLAEEVVVLFAATSGAIDTIPVHRLPAFEQGLLTHFEEEHPELLDRINRQGELTDAMRSMLDNEIARFQARWHEGGETH